MAGKKQDNFLEDLPVISDGVGWDIQDGRITIHMTHRGFCAAVRKLFRRPGVSHIRLDTLGSFVFLWMDGRHTVADIAQQVRAEFGQEAEPLYARLIRYLCILQRNGFICYDGKNKRPAGH